MLLKITHSPYVAAIWAYEHASRYLYRDDDSWHAGPQAQVQRRSMFASQISSSRKAKQAALTSRSEASLAKTEADARPNRLGADDVSDLKRMIARLSAQVNELTLRLDEGRR